MIIPLSRLRVLSCAIVALCISIGCASRGSTQLCEGFQSYATPQDVRNRINQSGLRDHWGEQLKTSRASDPRPPYQFLTMAGPFSLSGVEGNLSLIFYDERLMAAEFSTTKGREYMTVLTRQHRQVPNNPGKDITVDRRTKFRYDINTDGTLRFTWTDPKLEDQWLKWVRDNS